jgi:hypothetical protein
MSINRSNPTVGEILSRAASDPAFRDQLLNDPAVALAGYSLSAEDRAALSDRATAQQLVRDSGG